MARTYKTFDADYKASAVALAEKLTVPVAAAQLGITQSKLYQWVDKARPANPDSGKRLAALNSDRVYWTDEELAKIADEFVMLRTDNPFESATVLFEKAQRKELPGDRQRTIPGVMSSKPLAAAISKSWKNFLMKEAAAPVPAAPPEPEIQTVYVEVPRKLTFQEMLAFTDEPALEALLSAKRLLATNQFHQLLAAIAANGGATNLPKIQQFVPKLDAFEPVKAGALRIAVIGMNGHSEELQTEVKNSGLDVALQLPDGKDKTTVARCDYAIICRGKVKDAAASAADGDRAIGQLGRSRVILLDDPSTATVMQQIRNLCSRQ